MFANEIIEMYISIYKVYFLIATVLLISIMILNMKSLEKMSLLRLILMYVLLPYLFFRSICRKWEEKRK